MNKALGVAVRIGFTCVAVLASCNTTKKSPTTERVHTVPRDQGIGRDRVSGEDSTEARRRSRRRCDWDGCKLCDPSCTDAYHHNAPPREDETSVNELTGSKACYAYHDGDGKCYCCDGRSDSHPTHPRDPVM